MKKMRPRVNRAKRIAQARAAPSDACIEKAVYARLELFVFHPASGAALGDDRREHERAVRDLAYARERRLGAAVAREVVAEDLESLGVDGA